jgi:Flp pilus assembly protein TadG
MMHLLQSARRSFAGRRGSSYSPPRSRAAARAIRDARGTSSIEFGIVSVVFFTIFFGIVVFGAFFLTRIALSYAVAEGGRAALVGLTDAERVSRATSAVNDVLSAYAPLIDPTRATVSVTTSGSPADGEEIKVSISYSDHRFDLFPFVPKLSDVPPVSTVFTVIDPPG